MPDEWRAAIWEYVQAWPSSGCGYGPFVAVTEEQRCHFIRQMAKDLVLSDNIGCRSIAHDVGQFASLDFEIQEVPAGPPGLVCRAADEMILTAEDINLCLGSEELLPCPFCGASAMSHGERTPNGKAICWRITCTGMRPLVPDCAASVWGTHPELDKARAMAVRRWNRRDREGIIMDETPESKTGTAGVSSEPMHDWFSLSYASYLVIPRTILQSCTPENQQRLVDALDAIYDETQANMEEQWPHEAVIEVKLKDSATGRYRKDDLADYQRGRRRLWHDPTLAPR